MAQRSNMSKEQQETRTQIIRDEIDDLQEQINERQKELLGRGVAVNPQITLVAQVETLIKWAAPSEYGRARFDLQVGKLMLEKMADEVVDPVMAQQQKMAEEIQRAQQMAAAGMTQEGLYIPGNDAVAAVEASKANPVGVAPGPTLVPDLPPEPNGGEIRIG